MSRAARIQVTRNGDSGLWRWRLRAGNGRIVDWSGQLWTRRHDAVRAARRMQQLTATASVEILE